MKPNRKQEKQSPSSGDGSSSLPARQRQRSTLLQIPEEGVKLVIEEGAMVYYSVCRRLAKLLNRRKS